MPRPYLIVTSGRTGSSLLAHALAGTGAHGTPDEHLTVPDIDRWAEVLGVRSPLQGGSMLEYLDALRTSTSSPGGGFGTKLHSSAVPLVARCLAAEPSAPASDASALLAWAFPGSAVLWSRRRDRVAGSVSMWRARATGAWARAAGAAGEPGSEPEIEPPLEAISDLHRSMHIADLSVPGVLARAGFEVHEVVYEDLVADWPRTLAAAVAFLADGDEADDADDADGSAITIAPPVFRRQAGAATAATIERWVAATGGCAACGHPAPTGV